MLKIFEVGYYNLSFVIGYKIFLNNIEIIIYLEQSSHSILNDDHFIDVNTADCGEALEKFQKLSSLGFCDSQRLL